MIAAARLAQLSSAKLANLHRRAQTLAVARPLHPRPGMLMLCLAVSSLSVLIAAAALHRERQWLRAAWASIDRRE